MILKLQPKNIIALLLINISVLVSGEKLPLKFDHITLKDGLSQSSIYSICQDSKGFLWIGTLDGLNKYDGYTFQVYRSDNADSNTIAGNTIYSICEAQDSMLWIGTSNGLSQYNPMTSKFKNFYASGKKNGLADNEVRVVFEDNEGIIWIGTANGLNIYDPKSNTLSKLGEMQTRQMRSNSIWCISQQENGLIWIGTSKGFCIFNKYRDYIMENYLIEQTESSSAIKSIEINKKNVIRSIHADSLGYLWLGTNGAGLFRFNIKTKEFKNYTKDITNSVSISDDRVRVIFEDVNGRLWFGTYNGLNLFDRDKEAFFNYHSSPLDNSKISSNKVISITNDNLGQLWVGTFDGGLNKVKPGIEKFKLYQKKPFKENSISSNIILSIIEDKDSNLWIGTDKGIDFHNRETQQYKHYQNDPVNPNSLSDDVVYSLYQDRNGTIWAGTGEGILNRFNANTNSFKHYPLIIEDYQKKTHYGVRKIYEDKQGNFWIGSHSGLFKFNRETGTYIVYQHNPFENSTISSNVVWDIYEDSFQNLWVATQGGGINKFDRETGEFTRFIYQLKDTNSITCNTVRSIYEDHKKRLWVSTSKGLNRYNREQNNFSHITMEDGLPNNLVYSILGDGEHLWLSTNKGLSRLDPETLEITNYDMSDGLQSLEFNQGAYHKGKVSGQLYFGGINGLNTFFPNNIQHNPVPPIINITDFYLFNKPVKIGNGNNVLHKSITYTDKIELNYNQNIISFVFAAIHFIKPRENTYAYKMEGFDDDWVQSGKRRYITYTNIPPGNYTFKVKAANSDGLWTKQPAKVDIIIKPPFWKTNGFYIFVTIVILLLIYLTMRMRDKKMIKEKEKLRNKVLERTIEIEQQSEEIATQRDSLQRLYQELKQRNEEIETQRDQIDNKNRKMTDSIIYAQRIQKALLPSEEYLKKLLPSSFVLYIPKDIVSGDFYWVERKGENILFAAVDCTGHGVPGALMSIISYDIINQAINEHNLTKPSQVLNYIHAGLNLVLLTDEKTSLKEGMDISLCCYNTKTSILQYAGAFNPLLLVRNNQIFEYKADSQPIVVSSEYQYQKTRFSHQEIKIEKGDIVYVFTDGYTDQFGGTKRKKYLRKNFKKKLLEIHHYPLNEQKRLLNEEFYSWKGKIEQIDDVLVMGIKF